MNCQFNVKKSLTSFIIALYLSESLQVHTFTSTRQVTAGTNRLSCFPLEKARQLGKNVSLVSWHKWEPDATYHWPLIAGSNMAHVQIRNGSHRKYSLIDPVSGIFEIRNVTVEDSGDQYRCYVRGIGVRDSIVYKLHYFQPELGKYSTTLS